MPTASTKLAKASRVFPAGLRVSHAAADSPA